MEPPWRSHPGWREIERKRWEPWRRRWGRRRRRLRLTFWWWVRRAEWRDSSSKRREALGPTQSAKSRDPLSAASERKWPRPTAIWRRRRRPAWRNGSSSWFSRALQLPTSSDKFDWHWQRASWREILIILSDAGEKRFHLLPVRASQSRTYSTRWSPLFFPTARETPSANTKQNW